MRDEEREDLSKRSNFLRLELKAWEKEFSSSNNGQKASRDDIKKNPEIGAAYSSECHKIRANISQPRSIKITIEQGIYSLGKSFWMLPQISALGNENMNPKLLKMFRNVYEL